MATRIYFIRHGESESNLIHQFAGSLDMSLTERGREQAAATAAFLKDVPFTAVYSSDLKRAYDTAQAVAKPRGMSVIGDQRLREIYAGDWEGRSYDDLDREFAVSYGVWRTQIGLAQCPNGESVAQLQDRVNRCVQDIVQNHPNQYVCIVTHATPIRVMESLWTTTPLDQMHTIPWVSNASVTIVEYRDGRARLLSRDLYEHLGSLHTVLAKNV